MKTAMTAARVERVAVALDNAGFHDLADGFRAGRMSLDHLEECVGRWVWGSANPTKADKEALAAIVAA